MADFLMPSLGADMDEGTLVEWRVKPGDAVRRGQVVAVVETAKGAIDVEIFEDGEIETLLVEEGAKVPVGQPLARLRGAAPQLRASPAARRRARELGVALEGIDGSGPEGAITLADVEAAGAGRARSAANAPRTSAEPAATASESPASMTPASPADMRAVIAAAMTRSKREIPHYYLGHWIDLAPANKWLDEWNAARPVEERLLLAVLVIRAVALAAKSYPEFNGHFRDGAFVQGDGIHVGSVISLRRGGLVAPALRDADQRSLPELMAAFRDLVARARAGRLTAAELAGGTITVSSLGEQGVEEVFPVIYAPQVAIVGVGTPVQRPWVADGRVEPRWLLRTTLAADHRTSDGHRGALFLDRISRLMQEPGSL